MQDQEDSTMARRALAEAERVREQAHRSSRWFSGLLAAFGGASIIWITLLESVWPEGSARSYVAAGWAVVAGLAAVGTARFRVFPAGATKRMAISAIIWFMLYLVVIGPLARWQLGTSVPGWIAAATVMAVPFFAAAWMGRRP
ncbi:hypothetical protein [Nonomuraea sp. SYSU D8015]|uniref:hypothetical protein n=1 Tax=Nonomuraea sp. SYSU D8015 TaxID=2593644 RepID=UPI001660EE95|nr:hypothetical protein [Nonomuraea sp. SYSU D8015]